MHQVKILNTREVKKIKEELKEHFGSNEKFKDYAFLKTEKSKLYMISKDYGEIKDLKLRINRVGIYFGKEEKDGLRLSIEAAQMINATKNIVEIKDVEKFMTGTDVDAIGEGEGYVIVKHGNDVLGCARYKEGKILNYTPKERRISKDTNIRTQKCCK